MAIAFAGRKFAPCRVWKEACSLCGGGREGHTPRGSWIMKCRQLAFYAEPAAVESTMATITNEVIPRFSDIPHFLGYVVLQSDPTPGHRDSDVRRELTVMSFWSDGLADSDATAQQFISEVNRVAGTNPVRKTYDLLKAVWRDEDGGELASFPESAEPESIEPESTAGDERNGARRDNVT